MEELRSLIIRAQRGDLKSFGTIVQRFQDMAVGYAYTILGDFHLAEDAAQEAFITVYCELRALREPDAFPGWLRKIVFKHCDRIIRSQSVETVSLEVAVEIVSTEKDPSEAVEEQEMKEKVLAAIAALPEHERTVTTLFYINGYSQEEIAGFLEVPVTTVNSRLHYSRKRLKERMIKMVKDALHGNRPSRSKQFVERVLQFPKDGSIGTLYVRDGTEDASLDFDDWVELGQAQNTVKVESGQALALRIGREPQNDLSALAKLSPDDLQAIEIGRIDKNDDFRPLMHLRDLRYISVFNRGHNLDDEGLAKLIKVSPKLQGLKLQGFRNIDTALAPLRDLPNFRKLFMTEIRLTDRAWDDVAQISNLDLFFVDNINLNDEAATRFRFLPVPYLSMACCQITDKTMVRLASLHKKTGTPLIQLEIYGTEVSDKGLELLFKSIPKEKVENLLVDVNKATGRFLKEIEGMTNLQMLRLPPITDIHVEQLAKLSLPKLGELWLKSDAITDNSVEYLAKLKGLRYIFWLKSGTCMSKEGIAELQKALPECEIN